MPMTNTESQAHPAFADLLNSPRTWESVELKSTREPSGREDSFFAAQSAMYRSVFQEAK